MNLKPQNQSLSLPSFLWLLIFFFIPSLITFFFSFKTSDLYGNLLPGWTLSTWTNLWHTHLITLLWRTAWISLIATMLCLLLAIPVAYAIARASSKLRSWLLLLVVMPFWSSFLIRTFAWKALLHPDGLLKNFLVNLGIISSETSLLYNSGTVILVMVYTYIPFAILPIYAAASKFNFSLFEAVQDLGGSRATAFFRIFLPAIRAGIATAFIMVLVPAVGAYIIPDVVGGLHSEMIGNKIAQKVFIERNLPQASALSTLLSLLVLCPVTLLLGMQRKKMHSAPS